MKSFWCIFALFLALTVRAQDPDFKYSTKEVRTALIHTVDSQLQSVRAGDYSEALTFASRRLRRRLTPETFEQLVRRGYPLIAVHNRAEFGLAHDDGHRAVLLVTIYAPGGKTVDYNYGLVREEKDWRITAVLLAPASADI